MSVATALEYVMNRNNAKWRYMRQRTRIDDVREQLICCEWWMNQCKKSGSKGKQRMGEAIKLEAVQLIMRSMRCHIKNEVVYAAGCRVLEVMYVNSQHRMIVRLLGHSVAGSTGPRVVCVQPYAVLRPCLPNLGISSSSCITCLAMVGRS